MTFNDGSPSLLPWLPSDLYAGLVLLYGSARRRTGDLIVIHEVTALMCPAKPLQAELCPFRALQIQLSTAIVRRSSVCARPRRSI